MVSLHEFLRRAMCGELVRPPPVYNRDVMTDFHLEDKIRLDEPVWGPSGEGQ
jgi:hypothetical protein